MHADKKKGQIHIYGFIYKEKISGRKPIKLSSNCLWEVRPGIWRWKRIFFLVCPFAMHEIVVMCAYITSVFFKWGLGEKP